MIAPTVDPEATVRCDAYTGTSAATGSFSPHYGAWALARPTYGKPTQRPTPPAPEAWRDPRVGWGVILPATPGLGPSELATADDAPEPIRRLVQARGGKVLRYLHDRNLSEWTLRNYATQDELLGSASAVGMGKGQLPQYLLIYGTPTQIPWSLQRLLNPVRHVGRLDLDGEGLANYVDALLTDWSASTADYRAPVVWAVDHGGGDITTLMRDTVAAPLVAALDDGELVPTFLDGSAAPASKAGLMDALSQRRPALVVTSSHGLTGPLDDVRAMAARLGLLVDQDHEVLSPEDVLSAWQPDGAVWFAQACCSAGSESPSEYAGLFQPGSELDRVLTGVAAVGAVTAPLPRALLGAKNPLRAFVGHVEPTFDWTLSFPLNRQALTDDLVRCLYDRLCDGKPVGLAMSAYYPAANSLYQGYFNTRKRYETQIGAKAKTSLDMLVYSRVTGHDRMSTMVLGDPTVAIPLPPP